MSEKKGELKEFKPKEWAEKSTEEASYIGPTKEEIEEQMRKDEEEINERLAKFAHVMPKNADSSSVSEEEDEEEEDFALEFKDGKMIATQKEEKMYVRENGEIKEVKGAKITEGTISGCTLTHTWNDANMQNIPYLPAPEGVPFDLEKELNKCDPAKPYKDLISDVLVRKAISKLLKETRDAHDSIMQMIETLPAHMIEPMTKTEQELWKKKEELNKIIRGNKVWYEEIPDWVQDYVDRYIEDVLSNLVLLGEE